MQVAFHHVIPALCNDIQHSAPLLNHPGSITSETPAQADLPFAVVFSRALSLCFRYRWVCFSFFFSPAFQHLAVIFAVIEDSVWCAAPVYSPSTYQHGSQGGFCSASSQRNPATPRAPPWHGNPTSLSDHFFIYLTEKLHLERGGHNKGENEEKEGDEKPGGTERTNKARNQ